MFATAFLLAAALPQMVPAGTYSYHGTLSGAPTSTTKLTVTSAADKVTIAEETSGSINGISATANAQLALNAADLTPLSYSASYAGAGQTAKSSVAFTATQADVTGPTATKSFPLPQGSSHFVVLDGALLAGFAALPMQFAAWKPAAVFGVAPVYQQGLVLQAGATAPARPAGVPAADTALSIGGQIPFTIWYDPATLLMDELDVPSQEIIVKRDH